jgi:hypothetical protein
MDLPTLLPVPKNMLGLAIPIPSFLEFDAAFYTVRQCLVITKIWKSANPDPLPWRNGLIKIAVVKRLVWV